jgi:hypothetical protein
MSLVLVFNKNSPWAHTESELNVLGVHGKLVKYVVHSSKRKNQKKIIFLHTSCPNSNRPVFGLKEFYGLSELPKILRPELRFWLILITSRANLPPEWDEGHLGPKKAL